MVEKQFDPQPARNSRYRTQQCRRKWHPRHRTSTLGSDQAKQLAVGQVLANDQVPQSLAFTFEQLSNTGNDISYGNEVEATRRNRQHRKLAHAVYQGTKELIVAHADDFVTADGLGVGTPLAQVLALRKDDVVCGAHADRVEAYARLDEAWVSLDGPPSWMADLLGQAGETPSRATCERFAAEKAQLGALDVRPTDVQKELLESLGGE